MCGEKRIGYFASRRRNELADVAMGAMRTLTVFLRDWKSTWTQEVLSFFAWNGWCSVCGWVQVLHWIGLPPHESRRAHSPFLKGAGMAALNMHLAELLDILEASSGLQPAVSTPAELRDQMADQLAGSNLQLAERVRRLDDWQAEALADFVADAHTLAEFWDIPAAFGDGGGETRLG